jgi:hypothetical protein
MTEPKPNPAPTRPNLFAATGNARPENTQRISVLASLDANPTRTSHKRRWPIVLATLAGVCVITLIALLSFHPASLSSPSAVPERTAAARHTPNPASSAPPAAASIADSTPSTEAPANIETLPAESPLIESPLASLAPKLTQSEPLATVTSAPPSSPSAKNETSHASKRSLLSVLSAPGVNASAPAHPKAKHATRKGDSLAEELDTDVILLEALLSSNPRRSSEPKSASAKDKP